MLGFAYTSGTVWSIIAASPLVRTDAIDATDHNCYLSVYNAPTHAVGVFDDFLEIQPAQGNVSTMSYSDSQREFCDPT